MARSYKVPLHVCNTKGTIIVATITQVSNTVNRVELPFIEAVANDTALEQPDGKIRKTYDRRDHKKVLNKLTSYLESLFLKELGDEDNHSSKYSRNKSKGTEGTDTSEPDGQTEGKKPSGLHNSGGRRKSSSGSRRGKSETVVAESGDQES